MSEITSSATPPNRGRRRDPRIDRAILDAARRLFAAGGFNRISIEEIADEARVTRPTVYRRFDNKYELVKEALRSLRSDTTPPKTRGDLRTDLILHLEDLREAATGHKGMAMTGAVLVEEQHRPELLELFREGVVRPRRQMIRDMLEQAKNRGDIRDDVDLDTLVDLIIGVFHATYLKSSQISPDWAERAVDLLLPAIR
ncbi:TetR/AcrR family transcriptional regulator [Rhizohabitans arisaemae]|uniref:TetR/AcrR family transcriptional regulator n=1 Tax=Rhizohabitans arisaemae TaxID=2720610 RepID=UPI0024B095F2|nr:TetR/AcrR family transcriptional regulator [Rhizohabitans arisaemae]